MDRKELIVALRTYLRHVRGFVDEYRDTLIGTGFGGVSGYVAGASLDHIIEWVFGTAFDAWLPGIGTVVGVAIGAFRGLSSDERRSLDREIRELSRERAALLRAFKSTRNMDLFDAMIDAEEKFGFGMA